MSDWALDMIEFLKEAQGNNRLILEMSQEDVQWLSERFARVSIALALSLGMPIEVYLDNIGVSWKSAPALRDLETMH
ncbi:hypothetical protein LCGC14_3021330 [marine sediment metagenome]|uniref:Uncharacterized protein n=1 Tax=marine sediment metagenome TaxID=412755 RepID=A0A0F8WV80_9ZZZZ